MRYAHRKGILAQNKMLRKISISATISDMARKKKIPKESKSVSSGKIVDTPNVRGIVSLEQLFETGAHFGHRVDRWNPKSAPYLFGAQNGVHIFDLEKTYQKLEEALLEIRTRVAVGQLVLFVGTKPQAKDIVKKMAQELEMPFITERWLGGLLTNFAQIKKSIDKLGSMKRSREAGEYQRFTKKEQLLLDREIARLERFLGGVAGLSGLPDVLFVVDINRERTAVTEARKMGVTTVAIVDSNCDPTMVDFPIPANDDATRALEIIVGAVGDAVKHGLEERLKKARRTPEEQPVAATV